MRSILVDLYSHLVDVTTLLQACTEHIGSYRQDCKFKSLVQVKKILVLKMIRQYKSCKSNFKRKSWFLQKKIIIMKNAILWNPWPPFDVLHTYYTYVSYYYWSIFALFWSSSFYCKDMKASNSDIYNLLANFLK